MRENRNNYMLEFYISLDIGIGIRDMTSLVIYLFIYSFIHSLNHGALSDIVGSTVYIASNDRMIK
jgi:hypothetical protein